MNFVFLSPFRFSTQFHWAIYSLVNLPLALVACLFVCLWFSVVCLLPKEENAKKRAQKGIGDSDGWRMEELATRRSADNERREKQQTTRNDGRQRRQKRQTANG